MIFEFMLAPLARIQRILGCDFDEVEALLRDGPREEQWFVSLANLIRSGGVISDLDLDIRIHLVRIL
jgi:hypothetical protein